MGGDNYFGILRPHTELVSTNAVDTTAEFVAGTLYDLGAEVKVSAENNLYKCLTKDTTEIQPVNYGRVKFDSFGRYLSIKDFYCGFNSFWSSSRI